MPTPGRLSGILLPLFSLRTASDFGVGDFSGLPGLFKWMREAQQRLLMLLPLLPAAPDDPSPYATRSAFGLHPLFIDLSALPEWQALGGERALTPAEQVRLREARAAIRIAHPTVFELKGRAFQLAFDRFESEADPARRAGFEAFMQREGEWLDAYALFCALSESHRHLPWWEWPEGEHHRDPAALGEARTRLAPRRRFHAWLQWVAHTQWDAVRAQAREAGILLCGDEPFIVGQDSVDAWSHPTLLRRDARLGVPPDPFSATGQDWGLPWFDFAAMAVDGDSWLRARAASGRRYYDLRRIDHAVGYFRQYIRTPGEAEGRFIPGDTLEQIALGERLFRLMSEGADIVAEDLGVIPPFVRDTLQNLGIPGYKVMRWERHNQDTWINPDTYPKTSLVCTGTHDTEPMATWWNSLSREEKLGLVRSWPVSFQSHPPTEQFGPGVHYALLHAALFSGSDLCVLPWQDVMGTEDRINLPGSVDASNWSWRMPQEADALLTDPHTRQAASQLGALTSAAGR
ncbi:MAG TPA: 4-alpha-glucanotransferase [Myxococcaceae bacterium]|nr:4-alpha-glucanotransferase [Myxococcaceae bacterium]